MSLTIAIDGPAASGKGTIARRVAAHFGLGYLDTGLLYRATGRRVLEGEAPLDAARALSRADLDRADLRGSDVGQAASRVAADRDVRAALMDFQRAFARRGGGAVLDGRDIGTVICPDADAKLFITASDEVRAERRFRELSGGDPSLSLADVLADLQSRDRRDAGRAVAPLKPAPDAVTIDTTEMSIEDAVAEVVAVVERAWQR